MTKRRATLPPGKHEGTGFPPARVEDYAPFGIDTPGTYWVLSDTHCDSHDRATIEAGAAMAERRKVAGIILNGDILDFHDLSRHDKDRGASRYAKEIQVGIQLLAWLRARFPRARMVYKEGNHEERLPRYMMDNAPAFEGLSGFDVPSMLEFDRFGVEWVGEKRRIDLGKLPVFHGHEYRGGGGKYPAAWLFNKAHTSALCGHFHKTAGHAGKDAKDRPLFTWSVGCACYLTPLWLRKNEWNNGVAFVDVARDGTFSVDNLRMFNGKLI